MEHPAVDESQGPQVDLSRPQAARVYDYYLGGKNHFAADRELAEKVLTSMPSVRVAARENRAFLKRAVSAYYSADGRVAAV